MEVLGVKYGNKSWLLKHLDISVLKENIALSPFIPAMLCIFFHAKHPQNKTQVVLKVLDLDLAITNQPIGVSLKGIPSYKRNFTFTLRITNIVAWVIGKLPSLIKQMVQKILVEASLFGRINSTHSSQIGLNERDVALSWRVYLLNLNTVFIFSVLTHYTYCSTLISVIILRVLIIYYITLLLLWLLLLLYTFHFDV